MRLGQAPECGRLADPDRPAERTLRIIGNSRQLRAAAGKHHLLPALAGPPTLFAGSGFAPPLGPGTYTVWIQEGNGAVSYDLSFQVTAVPEPATLTAFGVLAAGAFGLRRRVRAPQGRA